MERTHLLGADVVGKPVQALVEAIAVCGAGGLDVPASGAKLALSMGARVSSCKA